MPGAVLRATLTHGDGLAHVQVPDVVQLCSAGVGVRPLCLPQLWAAPKINYGRAAARG